MSRTLLDTSVWTQFLRRKGIPEVADRVDGYLESHSAVLCGQVEMEILHGVGKEDRDKLMSLLDAVPYVEATRVDYRRAGHLLSTLRSQGIIIPSSDALIAAICLNRDLPLYTRTKHFDHIEGLVRA